MRRAWIAAAALLAAAGARAGESPCGTGYSEWSHRWTPKFARKAPRELDGFGVSNGRVFALAGTRYPLGTLHNILGPTFGAPKAFFGDMAIALSNGRYVLETRSDRIRRERRAAVVETESTVRDFFPDQKRKAALTIVDWAPPGVPAIIRDVRVTNTGDRALKGWVLEGYHWGGLDPAFIQARGGARMRVIAGAAFDGGAVNLAPRELDPSLSTGSLLGAKGMSDRIGRWRIAIPRLARGESWSVRVALVFSEAEFPESRVVLASVLADACRHWGEWFASGALFEIPDRAVADLVDSVALGIRLQQEPEGGVSPLSRYRKAWLRDTAGPLRYSLALGRPAEALAMADYLYLASLKLGRISNSYPNSLPVEGPVPEDRGYEWWRGRPFMSKRKAVEAPSYLVLQLDRYWRWTGDPGPMRDRYGFLKQAVLGQAGSFTRDGLLPMSGDETWRTNMVLQSLRSAIDFLFAGDENRLSVESHFLLAAAAESMARLARELGFREDAQEFEGVAARARAGAERYFWRDRRYHYVPFAIRRGGNDRLAPRPLAHVQYMALWSGYLDPRDPGQRARAELNLLATLGLLDRPGDGIPATPAFLGPRFRIFTGMEPGLLLWNLTELEHPLADRAFHELLRAATHSGNFFEFYWARDNSSVRLAGDPYGHLGNSTSLFRPWEGGINLEAIVRYLIGLEPDLREGRVLVRPHLPEGWPRVGASGLRLGGGRLAIEFSRTAGGLALSIDPEGLEGVEAEIEIPVLYAARVGSVRVNGAPAAFGIRTPWDRSKIVRLAEPRSLGSRPLRVEVGLED